MTGVEPYFEVFYGQADFPTGAPEDPFCPVDADNPPDSWTYGAVLQSGSFQSLFRVRDKKIQRLTVVGHHAESGYHLQRDHPVHSLVRTMMEIEPISSVEADFAVPVGFFPYEKQRGYYIRAIGWNHLPYDDYEMDSLLDEPWRRR
jgi:hypothetical protein